MKDPPTASEEVREHRMTSGRVLAYPALLGSLLGVVWVAPASADSPPCRAGAVEVEPRLAAAYPGLGDEVRASLAIHQGLEPCARVELGFVRSAIAVGVILADGRTATRVIADARDVVPVVEALLLVPEREPEAELEAELEPEPEPDATPAPKPAERPRPVRRLLAPELAAQPPSEAESRTGIEISLAAGARLGDGQSSVGLGALTFLELSSWLLGLGLRADRYDAGDGFTYTATGLSALVGHRFRAGRTALDLVAGPVLLLQTDVTVVETGPVEGRRETHTERAPRFAWAGHVHFGPASGLHPFIGVEGEAGLATPAPGPDASAQELPVWTVGVAFGGSVGTR